MCVSFAQEGSAVRHHKNDWVRFCFSHWSINMEFAPRAPLDPIRLLFVVRGRATRNQPIDASEWRAFRRYCLCSRRVCMEHQHTRPRKSLWCSLEHSKQLHRKNCSFAKQILVKASLHTKDRRSRISESGIDVADFAEIRQSHLDSSFATCSFRHYYSCKPPMLVTFAASLQPRGREPVAAINTSS